MRNQDSHCSQWHYFSIVFTRAAIILHKLCALKWHREVGITLAFKRLISRIAYTRTHCDYMRCVVVLVKTGGNLSDFILYKARLWNDFHTSMKDIHTMYKWIFIPVAKILIIVWQQKLILKYFLLIIFFTFQN